MDLVDSHCHLDDRQFSEDRDAVIGRARAAGIKYMLSIGTGDGPPDLACGIRLAEAYSFVYATVGVHPNDAAKLELNTFKTMEALLQHPKVKAVGEIGLDYHWNVPREAQLPVFVRQLELAAQFKKPVVIHTRDAWPDTLDVLEQHWLPSGLGCILHCFTGDAELARRCLDLGCHLAFGGVTTYPKAPEVREAARITPTNRLLLETDAPYLAPVPYRSKRNEPAFIVGTAEVIAALREVTPAELAKQTRNTFEQLFDIEPID